MGHVLILVLVEDSLREDTNILYVGRTGVLILVLVEDSLRGYGKKTKQTGPLRLNPCFSGR